MMAPHQRGVHVSLDRVATAGEPASPFDFTYAEFQNWYERISADRLVPAKEQLVRLLNEILDQELDEFERRRIRLNASRIKNPNRLWNKLLQKKRDEITDCESILLAVDDLIGLRIVCNNTSDIRRLQLILGALPTTEDEEPNPSIVVEALSERPYHLEPKGSGYRAYHLNIETPVAGRFGPRPYRAELQVRTLLQDAWGELTHEDTYKPGARLPPLAQDLALHMANLLATVDAIAEDIRNELDRAVQAAVSDDAGTGRSASPGSDEPSTDGRSEARNLSISRTDLMSELGRAVAELTKPTPLASLAHTLQSRFGAEVTRDWGGFVTFKALLRAAVPGVDLLEQGPTYVIPPGSTIDDLPPSGSLSSTPGPGLPPSVLELRSIDRAVPVVTKHDMVDLMDAMVTALEESTWTAVGIDARSGEVGLREVSLLTRYVRDRVEGTAPSVRRKDVDFFLKALLFTGKLHAGTDRAAIIDALANALETRMSSRGIELPDGITDDLRRWLVGQDLIAP